MRGENAIDFTLAIMAVTQILARIDPDTAAAASSSEGALDALISLRLRECEASCDFDWAPKYIELAARLSPFPEMPRAIEQAFEGESILNASFPDGVSGYTVYSEVRVNSIAKVKALAYELSTLPLSAFSTSKGQAEAFFPAGELPNNYEAYIVAHSEALRAFYAEAARREQVVVAWWD